MIPQLTTIRISLLNLLDETYSFSSVINLSETHARYDLVLSKKVHFLDKILDVKKHMSYLQVFDNPESLIQLIHDLYLESIREFWLEEKALKARLMNLWG